MAALAPPSFSASTSSLRASQSAPAAPISYADSSMTRLPTVDIPFDDLRRRMQEFTIKFDAFIEKGRKRVLEEREQFRGKLSELNEQNHATASHITSLRSTLSTHSSLLQRENAERQEILSSISTLESHSSSQLATRDRLKAAIAQTQREIDKKLAAQREYARRQDEQSRLNGPELDWWEKYLACRIEGAGEEGRVRVVYAFAAGRKGASVNTTTAAAAGGGGGGGEGEREAEFELKVPESGSGGYEVKWCRPRLEKAKLEDVVGKLNETRELGGLLKGMRALFAEEMK